MTTTDETYLKIGKAVCDLIDGVMTHMVIPPVVVDPELPPVDPEEPEVPEEPEPEPEIPDPEPPVNVDPNYKLISNDPINYKITTYKADSKGRPIEIFQPELATYKDDNYERSGNIIKVGCPYFGPKTSGSTNSTRHEFRGMTNEFAFDEKVQFITKYSLDEMDIVGRKVVTQQFHDKEQPIFKRVNRYLGDGIFESYILVKVADGDGSDAPAIIMGRYKIGEPLVSHVKYDGKAQFIYFEDNNSGIVKSQKLNRKGTGGMIYPKYLLYPQYIKNDEVNSVGKVCRATFYI